MVVLRRRRRDSDPSVRGIWGTLAVAITDDDRLAQIAGIVAIGAIVFGASWLTWSIIKWTIGVCITPIVEDLGRDVVELDIEAHPEFIVVPDPD